MKNIVIGIVLGALLLGIAIFLSMPRMMLTERASPYGHDKTVQFIVQKITNSNWIVTQEMDMKKSLAKHGKQVGRVMVLKICEPNHAEQILKDDDALVVSVMMPCSIAVYEKSDGRTYVSTMNAKLMGRMFGGTIADVMAGNVARETAAFTSFLD